MKTALRPIFRVALTSAMLMITGCDDPAQTSLDSSVTHDASGPGHDANDSSGPDDTGNQPDFSGGDGVATGNELTHVDEGNGTTVTIVDASEDAVWVYLDLDSKKQVSPTDGTWDLAFQRFRVKSNGGVSGDGDVAVATLDGQTFASVSQAPPLADNIYVTDQPDGSDDDSDPDFAFDADGTWYEYDPVNHTLAPRADRVYVVVSSAGAWFKVAMLDYYNPAGDAGFPVLRWSSVTAPVSGPTIPADGLAVVSETPAYFVLDAAPATSVTPAAPTTSTDWDLLFDGLGLSTNSGTSGPGMGGALVATDANFDTFANIDTVGFLVDAAIPAPGPPGTPDFSGNPVLTDWWNYDPATHTVSPKDVVFAVRRADGSYAKLKITESTSDGVVARFGTLTRMPMTHTVSIQAPSDGDWVYFNLRSGVTVSADDVAADASSWDIALLGTQWRTNSGTSGAGLGGAVAAGAGALAAVTAVPTDGYLVDAMLPIPGPPGSGDVSANEILAGWYDYDPVAHTVSPKDQTFVIKTVDGSAVKLKISGYDGGETSFSYVYAGPGHATF